MSSIFIDYLFPSLFSHIPSSHRCGGCCCRCSVVPVPSCRNTTYLTRPCCCAPRPPSDACLAPTPRASSTGCVRPLASTFPLPCLVSFNPLFSLLSHSSPPLPVILLVSYPSSTLGLTDSLYEPYLIFRSSSRTYCNST